MPPAVITLRLTHLTASDLADACVVTANLWRQAKTHLTDIPFIDDLAAVVPQERLEERAVKLLAIRDALVKQTDPAYVDSLLHPTPEPPP